MERTKDDHGGQGGIYKEIAKEFAEKYFQSTTAKPPATQSPAPDPHTSPITKPEEGL